MDPSGDIEVVVGNIPITYVDREPAGYDGCMQIIERDKNYQVVAMKYCDKGHKVCLHTTSIGDILFDQPDIPVEFDIHENRKEWYAKRVEMHRKFGVDTEYEVTGRYFFEYLKLRLGTEWNEDIEDEPLRAVATEFYKQNFSYKTEWPDDINKMNLSINDRNKIYWDRVVKADYNKDGLLLEKISETSVQQQ